MEIPNAECVMWASHPGACLLDVLKNLIGAKIRLCMMYISFVYVCIYIFYFFSERNSHCCYTEGAGRVAIQSLVALLWNPTLLVFSENLALKNELEQPALAANSTNEVISDLSWVLDSREKSILTEGNNIFPAYLFIAMLIEGESITCSVFTRAFIWALNI